MLLALLFIACVALYSLYDGICQQRTIAEQQERIRDYQQALAEMQRESKAEWGHVRIVDAVPTGQRTQPMYQVK